MAGCFHLHIWRGFTCKVGAVPGFWTSANILGFTKNCFECMELLDSSFSVFFSFPPSLLCPLLQTPYVCMETRAWPCLWVLSIYTVKSTCFDFWDKISDWPIWSTSSRPAWLTSDLKDPPVSSSQILKLEVHITSTTPFLVLDLKKNCSLGKIKHLTSWAISGSS